MFPDLSAIFYLAIVGLIALAIVALGGFGFGVWFLINHVAIV